MSENKTSLLRALTLTDAISLVVGSVIGTGVFLKTTVMTQQLGRPSLVMLAWLAAGLLTLAGALAYAELGAMFPHAGGEYVYLGKAYGEAPAFLYGWMQFAVAGAGGMAGISTGFAIFLSAMVPMGGAWIERTFHLLGQEVHWQLGLTQLVAVGAIVFFSGVNCLGVALGGRVQAVLTGVKLLGIAVIVVGIFFFSQGGSWSHLATSRDTAQFGGISAFGAAMMAALWAYNGWYLLPVCAGEVRDPQRNVPRGLIFGMFAVLATYLLANLAYFYALPLNEITTANSTAYPAAPAVASKAAQTFLGKSGVAFITIAFVVSTLGALNGCIMGQARIPFAMARAGLFFRRLGEVSPKTKAPMWAIIAQSSWGCVLALSGTFDQITNYVIFSLWLFLGVTVSAVFVLRRTMPNADRPYKTVGYPVVPILFILVAVWLVINSIVTSPIESLIGVLLIALGLPVYLFFRRRRVVYSFSQSQIAPTIIGTGE
ncbi:MAG TPA: amino acid permease [Pyrinomonadaceae bacterium]|jgi:APA family basic amino acid/polyamine antiporter|nr:amino acid permease [Pyrinomonadaceae bacterium]